MAPARLATTGTPEAMASTATRQNCSDHESVSTDGTTRTSKDR
jgi:hypothetical protein